MEERRAHLCIVRRGQPRIASRGFAGSHKLRKDLDIAIGVFAAIHIRISCAGSVVGNIITESPTANTGTGRDSLQQVELVGDALFVEISVARKAHQTGLLVLPAEAANAKLARRLGNRYGDDLALHTGGLAVWDVLQRGVGNSFNKA